MKGVHGSYKLSMIDLFKWLLTIVCAACLLATTTNNSSTDTTSSLEEASSLRERFFSFLSFFLSFFCFFFSFFCFFLSLFFFKEASSSDPLELIVAVVSRLDVIDRILDFQAFGFIMGVGDMFNSSTNHVLAMFGHNYMKF